MRSKLEPAVLRLALILVIYNWAGCSHTKLVPESHGDVLPTENERATLFISNQGSQHTSATIYVDEHLSGEIKNTVLEIADILPGLHKLRIERKDTAQVSFSHELSLAARPYEIGIYEDGTMFNRPVPQFVMIFNAPTLTKEDRLRLKEQASKAFPSRLRLSDSGRELGMATLPQLLLQNPCSRDGFDYISAKYQYVLVIEERKNRGAVTLNVQAIHTAANQILDQGDHQLDPVQKNDLPIVAWRLIKGRLDYILTEIDKSPSNESGANNGGYGCMRLLRSGIYKSLMVYDKSDSRHNQPQWYEPQSGQDLVIPLLPTRYGVCIDSRAVHIREDILVTDSGKGIVEFDVNLRPPERAPEVPRESSRWWVWPLIGVLVSGAVTTGVAVGYAR